MGTPRQPRQPAGTPQGGQFGATRSPEPEDINLGGSGPQTPGEAFRAELRTDPEVEWADVMATYDSCDKYLDTVDGEANMCALMEAWSRRLSEDLDVPNMFIEVGRTESYRNWWLNFGAIDPETGLYITGNSFYGTELLARTSPEHGNLEDQLVASYEASLPMAKAFADRVRPIIHR